MVIHIQTNMMGSGMGEHAGSEYDHQQSRDECDICHHSLFGGSGCKCTDTLHRAVILIAFQISYLLITEDVEENPPITILPRRSPRQVLLLPGVFLCQLSEEMRPL